MTNVMRKLKYDKHYEDDDDSHVGHSLDSRNRIQLLISIFGQQLGLDASYQH